MQPCKILIADDEKLARTAIRIALTSNDSIDIVAECCDGNEAIEKIRQHLPDIIFLDIQMPARTGFEVLGSLPKNYDPYLVIVSAHDNYALQAFEYDAIDYLLKPFSQQRFDKAFQKAFRQWEDRHTHDHTAIHALAERIKHLVPAPSSYKARISVKDGVKIQVVPCEDIMFIEASGDYSSVHTTDRKYLHSETLSVLETTLDPAQFARIHRSSIVNIKCIKELLSHYNGDYTVMLQNGHSLKLSRNYRAQVLQLIG